MHKWILQLFALASALCLSLPLTAQFENQSRPIHLNLAGPGPTSWSPQFMACQDFDNDGDLDLFADRATTGLVIYENLGGKYPFVINQFVDDDREFRRVKLVDMDQDGHLDFIAKVILADNSMQLFWYRMINGEVVSRKLIDNQATTVYDFTFADLNGDGYPDILDSDWGSTKVWLNEGGTGVFTAGPLINVPSSELSFLTGADLDNDGRDEVIAYRYSLSVDIQLLQMETNGDISATVLTDTPASTRSMALLDLNGDDLPDLLFYSVPTSTLYWMENTAGTFQPPQALTGLANFVDLRLFDREGDGDLDLLLTLEDSPFVQWMENLDGLSNFAAPAPLLQPGTELFGVLHPQLVDLDQDDLPDLIFWDQSYSQGRELKWFKNTGTGLVQEMSLLLKDFDPAWETGQVLADLDQDGDLDYAIVEDDVNFPGFTIMYEQLADQRFKLQLVEFSSTNDWTDFAFPMDYNDDGKMDLLRFQKDKFKLFLQDSPWDFNISNFTGFLTGRPLLAPMPEGAPLLLFVEQLEEVKLLVEDLNGPGFLPAVPFLIQEELGPYFARAIDFDLDGDFDLIYETFDGPTRLLENIDGSYQNWQVKYDLEALNNTISNNGRYYPLDLDHDGDTDLITARSNSLDGYQIYWNENENGNFAPAQAFYLFDENSREEMHVGDIDQDGYADLLQITQIDENDPLTFVWRENFDGRIEFSDPMPIADSKNDVPYLQLQDIDQDGYLDVAVFENVDGVTWRRNKGNYVGFNGGLITGTVFRDDNANQIQDADELGVEYFPIRLEPSATTRFTGTDGHYEIYAPPGDFTLGIELPANWELTIPDSSYSIQSPGNQDIPDQHFGLRPIVSVSDGNVYFTTYRIRCHATGVANILLENTGTEFLNGWVGFQHPDSASFLNAVPMPDSVDAATQTYFWKVTDLDLFATTPFRFEMQMPGVSLINAPMDMEAFFWMETDPGNYVLQDQYFYTRPLGCSYDPNDKLVEPDRLHPANPILPGEALTYTVRFQNTGNDTAFQVVIRDVLHPDLDWNTLRPIAASHEMSINFSQQSGLVEFQFVDILLPDSTTNEPASHGYVLFEIYPKNDLPLGSFLTNQAAIYFDFNPPIYTNTTWNTLVPDLLPRIEAPQGLEACWGETLTLQTGPAESYLWNTGETTQSITVSNPGNYNVTVTGDCGQCSSETITVNFVAPAATDISVEPDTLFTAGSANLHVPGELVFWYENPDAATPVATGNTFSTPTLSETTTYYAEVWEILPEILLEGGAVFPAGLPVYEGSQNDGLQFTALEDCELLSVEVRAKTDGLRTFLLSNEQELLDSISVVLEAGVPTAITFPDRQLQAGQSYVLTTDTTANLDLSATLSPWLEVDPDIGYPLFVGNSLEIESNLNSALPQLPYFFNWQLRSSADTCISDRQAVIVHYEGPTAIEVPVLSALSVYPNPANQSLHIALDAEWSARAVLQLHRVDGQLIERQELPAGLQTKNLQTGHLPEGLYLLSVISEAAVWTAKVVIQH